MAVVEDVGVEGEEFFKGNGVSCLLSVDPTCALFCTEEGEFTKFAGELSDKLLGDDKILVVGVGEVIIPLCFKIECSNASPLRIEGDVEEVELLMLVVEGDWICNNFIKSLEASVGFILCKFKRVSKFFLSISIFEPQHCSFVLCFSHTLFYIT